MCLALGAGSNTFAEIRRQRQMYPLRTVRVRNLLSALNPLPITITYLNGLIDVRIKGQENPIISVTDDDPLTINYISFSSWGNSEGKWFFDCAGDENRLKVVEPPNRTAIEKLRDALFTDYDANMVPMNLSNVFWKFNLKFADFDAKKAQIVTRGKFRAVNECVFVCLLFFFAMVLVEITRVRMRHGNSMSVCQIHVCSLRVSTRAGMNLASWHRICMPHSYSGMQIFRLKQTHRVGSTRKWCGNRRISAILTLFTFKHQTYKSGHRKYVCYSINAMANYANRFHYSSFILCYF